jgi:hypothetical protein
MPQKLTESAIWWAGSGRIEGTLRKASPGAGFAAYEQSYPQSTAQNSGVILNASGVLFLR